MVDVEKITEEISKEIGAVKKYMDGTAYNNAGVRAEIREHILYKYFKRRYEYKDYLEEYLKRKNIKYFVASTKAFKKFVDKEGFGWCKKWVAETEIWTNVSLGKIENKIIDGYKKYREKLRKKYKNITEIHKQYLTALTKREFLDNFLVKKYECKIIDENLRMHIYTIVMLEEFTKLEFVKNELPIRYIIIYQDRLRNRAFACRYVYTKNLNDEFVMQNFEKLRNNEIKRQGDIYFIPVQNVNIQDKEFKKEFGKHVFSGFGEYMNGELVFKGVVSHPEHQDITLNEPHKVVFIQAD